MTCLSPQVLQSHAICFRYFWLSVVLTIISVSLAMHWKHFVFGISGWIWNPFGWNLHSGRTSHGSITQQAVHWSGRNWSFWFGVDFPGGLQNGPGSKCVVYVLVRFATLYFEPRTRQICVTQSHWEIRMYDALQMNIHKWFHQWLGINTIALEVVESPGHNVVYGCGVMQLLWSSSGFMGASIGNAHGCT